MTTRLTARVGAAALAAALISAPAFAATTTTRSNAHMPPPKAGLSSGANAHRNVPTAVEPAVADLNAQSLAAAQAGQTFTPPGAGAAPPATEPAPPPARKGHKNM